MGTSLAERAIGTESVMPGVLSLLSIGAAAIHFAVIGEHFEEYWLFGVFFLASAWFQAAWAVLVVVRPSRELLVVGATVNAAIVVLWLWSRTSGLPIGPEAGEPEAASFIDVVSTVAEALLVVGCLVLLRSRGLRPSVGLFLVAAVLTVGTTSWALATSAEGGHHEGTEEPAGGHEGHESGGLGSTEIQTLSLANEAKLQAFVSGIAPGKSQLHLTFLNQEDEEFRVAPPAIQATTDGEHRELTVTRLGPGHFVSSSVSPGQWTFDVTARAGGGGELTATFSAQVES